MLKNYLKVVFRSLVHRRTASLINILGLAFAIAACLVIYAYVAFEKSYDNFHENADQIYRLKNVRYYTSGTDSSTGCVARLGPTLMEELPEVIDFCRVRRKGAVVTYNNIAFTERDMFWADSSFLTMFSFPLISGDARHALTDRYTAVVTENTAQKYFGDKNATGETIRLDGMNFKITGIAENVPPNSHIKFDILLSFSTQLTDRFCWGCNNTNTYIQAAAGTKRAEIATKLPSIVSKLHDRQEDGFDRAYFLQPLRDIHLHSNLRFEHEENGNAKTVHFLSLIAVLIVLIAWINYINLSTARSLEGAKEVGLRKVVGAGFWTLVRRFLLESFIINLVAVAISVFIAELSSPYWKQLVGLPASFSLWQNPDLIGLLAILVLCTPVIAGFYPAFVLSSYSPVSILRGSFKHSARGLSLRKGLVIFQFSISIMLIAAIIVFDRQLSFMRNQSLGFDIEQKLVVNAPARMENGDRASIYDTFINELRNQSLVEDATFTSVIPGTENGEVSGGVRQGEQSHKQGKQVYFVYVAQNYLDFFGVDLLSGRNFFESELGQLYRGDDAKNALLINESAARAFGFASYGQAIGASIFHDNRKIGNVIGVIRDYHQQSLDKEIRPTVFEGATSGNYFVFDINTRQISKRVEAIKRNYSDLFPGNPFEYNFLDEFFDRQYKSDIQTAEILSVFTFLSILISCLGLVGLSSLMTIHRTKEVGIRKVLGASISGVVAMLTRDFTKWVLLANLLAWPIAWLAMTQWLQNFAYRIEMSWWMFALAGGFALLIALLTVGWQAVRAATANPVEALRYE